MSTQTNLVDALREAEAGLEIAIQRILKRDPGHAVHVTSEAKALVMVRQALQGCNGCAVQQGYVPMQTLSAEIKEPQKFTGDSEMRRAFEIEYGQSWTDPDWRKETGIWASAWHKATASAQQAAVHQGVQQENLGETCTDGGKCHHDCKDKCFRRECCVPLSAAIDDGLTMEQWRYPATHPTRQGLDLRQLQEIKRAVDDFANFSETDIDYELLLRAAQARYLECTHFAVWNKAALERDLAAAQAKQGEQANG